MLNYSTRIALRKGILGCSTLLLAFLLLLNTTTAQVALPPEVPPFEFITNGTPTGGYLFVTAVNMQSPTYDYPSTVMLFSPQGELIYYLPATDLAEGPYPRTPIGNFQMHNDGRMSFTDGLFGPIPGSIYMMDSTFRITDTLSCTPQYALDGHDFFISDDGHYHILAMEERVMDASSLTTEGGQIGDVNCVVTGHVIQEFDENFNLVGEWKTLDHFSLEDTYSVYFNDPLALNHAHVNSIFVDFDGNYIISSRSLNEITRINRTTGQIMWRLGGKNNQFSFPLDTVAFSAQHDAQYFSDGTLVLFDNATFTFPDDVSRMLVYDMDETNMTATDILNFQHPLNYPSGFMGSARLLPNDNFVISWGGGYNYAGSKGIQEFDPLWNEAMSLNFEDGVVSYRAVKSELPWPLERPTINCDDITQTLTASDGYTSYYWSTGDTTQVINVSNPGTYQVWGNTGSGFVSSTEFEIADISDLCLTLSANSETTASELNVYPNPANDQLNIAWAQASASATNIELIDLQGRVVFSFTMPTGATSERVDVSALPAGIYHLRASSENSIVVKRFSLVR